MHIPGNLQSEDIMKIMVGYNGSRESKKAIELAVDHARAFNGRIVVVASMDKGTESDQEAINTMEKELEAVQGDLADRVSLCETHLLARGLTPGEELIDYAREHDIDEIILAIQNTSKAGKLVFGLTAQYIILNADCPVVTVK
jgi:nucleotide-binding universal stress UspA family protein